MSNPAVDALLGVAIGDALGVPYEFKSRRQMQQDPVMDMTGYGTHYQPAGTWSDDSALTFCLAESLISDYDLKDIALKFIQWKNQAYWSAREEIFDIGITTSIAIDRLQSIISEGKPEKLSELKENARERDNGNGSLMRIMPLLFYIQGKPMQEQFDITWEVSALTHRHIRAAMSCFIYLKMAEHCLNNLDKEKAYQKTRQEIAAFWEQINFPATEKSHFERLIQNDIRETAIEDLKSGGYVIEVLESSFWFLLNNNNYKDTVLSIINIGHDTDTSAAITGGLAGIYYGQAGMPENWLTGIARYQDIIKLGNKLNKISSSFNDKPSQ